MAIEKTVRFLNIDLVIGGRFDRAPLVRAFGDEVFALDERAPIDGVECLIIELNKPNLDLPATLDRLVAWVKGLPRPAKRAWSNAARRVFDIGVLAGSGPNDTSWTISPEHVAAIAQLDAEIMLTVYGAERRRSGGASRKRAR